MSEPVIIAEIEGEEALEWIKTRGAVLVDVRELNEIEQIGYAVDEQVVMPVSVFSANFLQLPDDKPLIMACRSGARSMSAATFLRQKDFTDMPVVNLKGGILRWSEKGLPVKGIAAAL
ncbi:MAG: rhodanese-like domain-containing protein [Chitinophagaceae bacterium]|jgi:rhodanese-related sulfurtransferase|nr:rhodanese-like domain-containing protein [Chitinophagaceae bacterium]